MLALQRPSDGFAMIAVTSPKVSDSGLVIGITSLIYASTTKASIDLQLFAPDATQNGRIELLRGNIESAMGDWVKAAKELQAASGDLSQNEQMSMEKMNADLALGEAFEHMGDKDAALSAYLQAASGLYQTAPSAYDNYVRLFVASGKGTKEQAENSLLLAVKEHRAKEENKYVPVELHQSLPKLQLTDMNEKTIRLNRSRHPMVVDLWATWCSACALELPSLLAFQESHPEVEVLAVDVADSRESVTQFLAGKKLTGLHVALIKAFLRRYGSELPNYLCSEPETRDRLLA